MDVYKGTGAFSGIAIGKILYYHKSEYQMRQYEITDVKTELNIFRQARTRVMEHCLKSTTSSVRDLMACSTFSSFASRLCLRFSSPFSIARDTFLPCCRKTSRFSSTVSSSAWSMRCCNSGDCGIFPNWSCDMMTQS